MFMEHLMPVPYRKVRLEAWACSCQRCGHEWTALLPMPPSRCARCKDPRWTLPADRQRIDRLPEDDALGGPEVVFEDSGQRVERVRKGRTWFYRFLRFETVDGHRRGGDAAMPHSGVVVTVPTNGRSTPGELLTAAQAQFRRRSS